MRTDPAKRRSALLAEASVGWIIVLAARHFISVRFALAARRVGLHGYLFYEPHWMAPSSL